MKKVLAVILTISIMLSFAVIPAYASGFSAINVQGPAIRGEFQGLTNSNWTLSSEGSGVNRVAKVVMNKAWKANTKIFDNACDTSINAHFAHISFYFAIKQVGSEKIVFRINPKQASGSSNDKPTFNIISPASSDASKKGWVSAYGGYKAGITDNDQCFYYTSEDENDLTSSNGARDRVLKGKNDTPVWVKTDLIFDCKEGYSYIYLDGKLNATMWGTGITDGVYRGFSIIGTKDESVYANGTTIWMKYDPERPGDTIYNDTDNYIVRVEDVLADVGLAEKGADPDMVMETHHIADYIFSGVFDYSMTKYMTYERRVGGRAVAMTAEKRESVSGPVASMLGGFYYKDKDFPGYTNGKGTFRVSFDQKINGKLESGASAASKAFSFVLRSAETDNNLLYIAPNENDKMKITVEAGLGANNPKKIFEGKKFIGDSVHIDMIFTGKDASEAPVTENATAIGYYFIDGEYIGAYKVGKISQDRWSPTQLLLSSDSTADVTFSNFYYAVYDENKNAEDIVAKIGNKEIKWRNIRLKTGTGEYKDCFKILGRIVEGKDDVPTDTKVHIGIYASNGKLLDYDSIEYTKDIESKKFKKDYNGKVPQYAKLLVWNELKPLGEAEKVTITFPDTDDSLMSYEGENGNWWVADFDTGIDAYTSARFRINPLNDFLEVSYDNGMYWNKLDYRADNSGMTEYNYPVEEREILKGTIRAFDNIYIDTSGKYAGSLIDVKDSVFDTVTLTKGENEIGYAFLAAKPEIYTNAKKLPNGYTPTYAAGYTRVIYTDNQEVTLKIPDNAKYLYLYDNGINDDTSEYENYLPSAVKFSKSGEGNTHNPNTLRIATWNIGHFCLGSYTYSTIDSLGFTVKEYKDYLNAINADIVSLNEYSKMFTSSIEARSAIFDEYPTAYVGVQNQYTCNALFARNNLLSNIEPHYFDCYTAAGGSGTDKPTDHYYITSDLTVNGQTVKFVNVHLHYSDNPQDLAIEAINELIDVFSSYDKVILLGDCNVTYEKFKIFQDAGYGIAQTDSKLATYGPCQGDKYYKDIAEGYGTYDNIIYKGVTISNFALGGTKLSDHYGLYCDITVD